MSLVSMIRAHILGSLHGYLGTCTVSRRSLPRGPEKTSQPAFREGREPSKVTKDKGCRVSVSLPCDSGCVYTSCAVSQTQAPVDSPALLRPRAGGFRAPPLSSSILPKVLDTTSVCVCQGHTHQSVPGRNACSPRPSLTGSPPHVDQSGREHIIS